MSAPSCRGRCMTVLHYRHAARTGQRHVKRVAAITFAASGAPSGPITLLTLAFLSRSARPIPVQVRPMQPAPTIPGYELLAPLGGGPLTCVFAAHDDGTDEPCAVKLLRPEWDDDPTAIKLLQREARAGLMV